MEDQIQRKLHEIDLKVTKLEAVIHSELSGVSNAMGKITDKLERHSRMVFGDEDQSGLRSRIEKLEYDKASQEKEQARKDRWMGYQIKALATAVTGLASKFIWELLT